MKFVILCTVAAIIAYYHRPARHRAGMAAPVLILRLRAERAHAHGRRLAQTVSRMWETTEVRRHAV